ncbi:hypothetical protein AVEN_223105-1 [Araneus ventricosus]|uniref:Uncharacterized protein n=1 Tax=Araneus ventricosus TaxID=182803 RepID=A0A4Y2ECF4_ARAVE|nr:hypothetical protein AVEN_223105-1 [Araneus ventricosus]
MGVQKEAELKTLAKNFAAHGISAAGISYIVTEQSSVRRALWFIGVMGAIAVMGYMTINVIMEYLSYPKVLDAIRYTLPFPAVTICSLNPISSHHVAETSLKKVLRLKEMMHEATMEQFNRNERDECYVNPLCKWSWFQERCYCVPNPCLTEFCLAENSSHCTCSTFFCNSLTKRVEDCEMKPVSSTPFMNETCQCKGTSTQDSWGTDWAQDDIQDNGVYLKAGPTSLTRIGRNLVCSPRHLFPHHCLKGTLFQISVWNSDWVPNLGCMWVGGSRLPT